MYCKHCGKEIADDSRFCSSCGANQDLGSTSVQSEEDLKLNEQSVKVSNSAYLWKRLLGSIIDKALILLISLIVVLVIGCFDYGFFGELGLFGAMLHMSKNSVYCAALGHVISLYNDQNTSLHLLEIDNRFQYLIFVELKIAYLFILINIVYYVICEKLTSSSLGKLLLKLKLVSYPYSSTKNISTSRVFYRATWFFIITSLLIALRWYVGFSNFVTIILFFLIIDLPVLFKRASLLDILTRTKLISYNKDKFPKEITHIDYNEKNVGNSNKVNRKSCSIFNVSIFLILISLIFILVHFSFSYANFKSQTKWNYEILYNSTERFAGIGYHLTRYNEPSDVKELVGSDGLLGRYVSTLGFKDAVKNDYDFSWYKFQCTISTYDISNIKSIFGNNEKKHEQYLSLLSQKTYAKNTFKNGVNVLTWYGNENKFMGVCANDRLYILKIESELNLDSRSDWIFDLFDFTYYPKIKYYQSILWIITLLIGICCIFYFAVYSYKFKAKPITNRYSYSLFILSLLSIAINILIACIISHMLNKILYEDWSMILLFGSEATATISSLFLSVFYYRHSKLKWDEYYIVPPILKNYFCDNINSDKSKKIFIKCVCYPIMILSLLPCGFYIVFIYSVPLLMVIIYKRWHNWARESWGRFS